MLYKFSIFLLAIINVEVANGDVAQNIGFNSKTKVLIITYNINNVLSSENDEFIYNGLVQKLISTAKQQDIEVTKIFYPTKRAIRIFISSGINVCIFPVSQKMLLIYEKKRKVLFVSRSVVSVDLNIISRKPIPIARSMEDLKGQNIGLLNQFSFVQTKLNTASSIYFYNREDQGIKMLASGRIDYLVGNGEDLVIGNGIVDGNSLYFDPKFKISKIEDFLICHEGVGSKIVVDLFSTIIGP
ncbi:hypothetical protein [Neptunomonas antarctica]|uniref:ABC-type amino acid transport substrate-binding protein n=1 Tax=Neptunomonas antarctica TaxID=619304 RepID=A0A1N7K6Z6_9GAMM|nr:hypothetical protein [Neptunomonas antarctica]SIS57349.1 hypothetical protein SAMN05421760_102229 [Neptunomonas antarctica]